jgi:transposase
MSHLNSETKHHILLEYIPHSYDHSFNALAIRHNIKGGKRTLINWYKRWKHESASLNRKKGSGKKAILSRREAYQYIQRPVKFANQHYTAIHYPNIIYKLKEKTGKQISERSVRRYGKNLYGIKKKRSIKRTIDECQ